LARFWQKCRSVEVLACVAEPGDQPGTPQAQDHAPAAQSSLQLGRFSASTRVAPPMQDGSGRPHVFIGPPGVGKTTLLCKWMTRSVLNESQSARVWRLDSVGANTAEFLNVYGEMLGIVVERFWGPSPVPADLLLVDLPGAQPDDPEALSGLKDLLAALPAPRIHLVLNAAYEPHLLADQFRAFAPFQPEDLSFCHLDEEKRQGKLLDFLLGTNCCLRFLSAGQKVPGDLIIADGASRNSARFAG
jgi:flagellar biosynthesis protein FlhF